MFIRHLAIFVAALLLFPLSLFAETKAKYLFLLIGDGIGPNVVKLYRGQMDKTSFDRLGTPVSTGTNNVLGKTTDSAASGTALACGIKTYNGALGVNKDKVPVTSLAKLLQKRGMKIGIISSVGINDATPGSHYANRTTRKDYAGSIADMLVSGFDFFGVSTFLMPKELPVKDLHFMLKRNKFSVYQKQSLDVLKKGDKNVFISRTTNGNKPSLADVTKKAIELLDNPNGFFMMVEGGAIDGQNHQNSSSGMMREMIEFDKVIATVLDFQAKHPEETLVVVTADHDTGGIAINGDIPKGFWKKQTLNNGYIDSKLKKMLKEGKSKEEIVSYARKQIGLDKVSDEGAKRIDVAADRFMAGKKTEKGSMYGKYNPLVVAICHERDAQNNFKYTTFGHTPTKVLTFAVGNGSKLFTAPLENSDIPRKMSIAATGEDLLEKHKNERPFPPAPVTKHTAVQSVSKDTVVCRANLGDAKKMEVTLAGNGEVKKK